MKFAEGHWVMRRGVRAAYAADAYETRVENERLTIIAATQILKNRGMTIGGPTITLRISSPLAGVLCFELIPRGLLSLFSHDEEVFAIGATAFRIIGASFFPAVLSLMLPVFFQAIGKALPSVMLSLTRQVFCLIPLFWGFSLIGLDYAWIAFPAAELITGAVGAVLYFRQTARWKRELPPRASGQERAQGAAG